MCFSGCFSGKKEDFHITHGKRCQEPLKKLHYLILVVTSTKRKLYFSGNYELIYFLGSLHFFSALTDEQNHVTVISMVCWKCCFQSSSYYNNFIWKKNYWKYSGTLVIWHCQDWLPWASTQVIWHKQGSFYQVLWMISVFILFLVQLDLGNMNRKKLLAFSTPVTCVYALEESVENQEACTL